MKKIIGLLAISYFIVLACNNTADDSVEKADSANKANTNTNTAETGNKVTTDEKSSSFLVRAANAGMAEVQLAKLAQQKATVDAVKKFAAMLEKDHSGVNEQVKLLATQRNVTLPGTTSDEKQKMYTDMEKMTGKNFDKEYISMMVKSHNDGIDLFEDTRTNASDVDIKNFADKTLPALKMHRDSAQAIQKRYW